MCELKSTVFMNFHPRVKNNGIPPQAAPNRTAATALERRDLND
jgi:hypothetical protein